MWMVTVNQDASLNSNKQQAREPLAQSGLCWLWLSVLFLILDQVTKYWVATHMQLGSSIEILPVFNFTYAHNYGAAFSFLGDAGGWQRWLFTAIAVTVSGLLLLWMRQLSRSVWVLNIAYALILSGALGNLYDRLAHGYVIDFIHFFYQDWHYPIFNIADIAICCGAVLLLFDAFKSSDHEAVK